MCSARSTTAKECKKFSPSGGRTMTNTFWAVRRTSISGSGNRARARVWDPLMAVRGEKSTIGISWSKNSSIIRRSNESQSIAICRNIYWTRSRKNKYRKNPDSGRSKIWSLTILEVPPNLIFINNWFLRFLVFKKPESERKSKIIKKLEWFDFLFKSVCRNN